MLKDNALATPYFSTSALLNVFNYIYFLILPKASNVTHI